MRRIIASFLSGFVILAQETGMLAPEEARRRLAAPAQVVTRWHQSDDSNVIITKFRSNAVFTVSLSVWLISIILIMNNNQNIKYRY